MRRRRYIRWACTAAFGLLAAAWTASLWCFVQWQTESSASYHIVLLRGGSVAVMWGLPVGFTPPTTALPAPPARPKARVSLLQTGATNGWPRWRDCWMPRWATAPRSALVQIPLWPVVLALAAPTVWLWARHLREVRVPTCAACGYDRRGLPAGVVCPECGAHEEAEQAHASRACAAIRGSLLRDPLPR